jgi:hypothetical protein
MQNNAAPALAPTCIIKQCIIEWHCYEEKVLIIFQILCLLLAQVLNCGKWGT